MDFGYSDMDALQVCLWGDNNFRNYTSAIANNPSNQLLVLAPRKIQESVLKRFAIKGRQPLYLDWPEVPTPDDFHRLESYLSELSPDLISLNLSSGSRLNAMQLLRWNDSFKYECYVIDEDDHQHWLYPTDRPSTLVPDLASLKAYFHIHQIDLLEFGMGMPISSELKSIVQAWASDSRSYHLFRSLNWLASTAQPVSFDSQEYRSDLEQDWHSHKLYPLLNDLQTIELIHCHENYVTFHNEACRFFCNGGWLELYVYEQIRSLKSDIPEIQDVRIGQKVGYKEGVTNELDIVFLADNQLHIVEVKTSYLSNKSDAANQLIYKLEALTNTLGEEVKGMVISLYDLPDTSQKRAQLYDISIASGSRITQLHNYLRDWINT